MHLSSIDSRREQIANSSDLSLRRRLPRVLVVDDNPNTMSLMHDLLSTRGYDVVAVPDAVQAETEIMRRVPDVILSDVIMPGKSGYELCRELKENPATRLIPFVLITGLSEREDRVRGIEAGAVRASPEQDQDPGVRDRPGGRGRFRHVHRRRTVLVGPEAVRRGRGGGLPVRPIQCRRPERLVARGRGRVHAGRGAFHAAAVPRVRLRQWRQRKHRGAKTVV